MPRAPLPLLLPLVLLGPLLLPPALPPALAQAPSEAPSVADAEGLPLFAGLGDLHRRVQTDSPEAQQYFDQGWRLYWAFNHEEAIRSFREATLYDPELAMGYWGIALSAGPNINNPWMDEAACELAWENVQKAMELANREDLTERDLIEALSKRYANPAPEDRAELDLAYANAMRAVWKENPEDPDVTVLCAEAVMDLRPWDLWSAEGEARPETPEVIDLLEKALAEAPLHPGANHLLIHTWEASPQPERADGAATVLRDLVPGAGHLVHMPAHIDIRLGRYAEAIAANQRAVAADARYIEQGGHGAFFTMYHAHNWHFLAYAAMFAGQRELALDAAHQMIANVPLEMVREIPDFLDGFLAVPTHVYIRFGMWDEMLAAPLPPEDLPVTTAFWHYGRAVAFAATGKVDESEAALADLRVAYQAVPDDYIIGNNTALTVLEIALPFAEGELEYRRGNHQRAFELLRDAVALDDELRYDEPWGWMEPVRHALGALLLEQGHVKEAEAVYREDLRLHPDNGWALTGLAECLRRTDRPKEAAEVEARLAKAWADADIQPKVSCFCRKGA